MQRVMYNVPKDNIFKYIIYIIITKEEGEEESSTCNNRDCVCAVHREAMGGKTRSEIEYLRVLR